MRRSIQRSTRTTARTLIILSLVVAITTSNPILVSEREWVAPAVAIDPEPSANVELGFELPPADPPVHPVNQSATRGLPHGLLKTSTGTLAFRMWDLKLPGRMPIAFGRLYDSALADFLPPPPPGQKWEPRWDQDLGKNWILGMTAYLISESRATGIVRS